MKKVLFVICCLAFLATSNSIAEYNSILPEAEILQSSTEPKQSGSSVLGGIIILLSIGIGYISRRIYETRSRNQEEIQ